MDTIGGYEVVEQSDCFVKLAVDVGFYMADGDRLLKEHDLLVTNVQNAPDSCWKSPVVWVTCVRASWVRG